MRILLDECLPRRLKQALVGYNVSTAPEMGWAGVKNGALLRLAASQFDVFITLDKSLRFQQNLAEAKLAVILLAAPDSKIETLIPLVPQVMTILQKTSLQPGRLIKVSA